MDDRWEGRVYVKESPIRGLGVFAARDFAAGEMVFVRGEARLVAPDAPLDPAKGEFEYHCDWLWDGRQVLLPVPDRHVNHSCEPNSYLRWIDGRGHNVALQSIKAGEEITHSYCVDLWDGRSWRCNCRLSRCLGMVPGSFFKLPLERQVELAPPLNEWFIAEHREAYEAFRRQADLV